MSCAFIKEIKCNLGKGKKSKTRELIDDEERTPKRYTPPPDKPTTDLKKKYERQPEYLDQTGMQLHHYQLEVSFKFYFFARGISFENLYLYYISTILIYRV